MTNLFSTPARLFRTTSAIVVLLLSLFATAVWLLLALFTAGNDAPGAILVIATVGLLFALATAVFGLSRNATVPLAAGLLPLVLMLWVLVDNSPDFFGVTMAAATMAPAMALVISLCVATCLEGGVVQMTEARARATDGQRSN